MSRKLPWIKTVGIYHRRFVIWLWGAYLSEDYGHFEVSDR